MLELVAGAHVAEFGLHHGAEVAGGVVVELENPAQITIEDDHHASAEIVGLHEVVNPFADRLSASMSRFKRVSLWVAAVLTVGCRGGAERQTAPAANDIPVGVYAALTGGEGSFGKATLEGVQLAADEINAAGGIQGRKGRLIIEDDQGRAEDAASVVTKRITRDRASAVIGQDPHKQA